MKKFRISSPLNLHCASKENISEYIKQGLLFHKEMGFDAADFATGMLSLTTDDWKGQAEKALSDANEIGITYNICHLPFIGGGGAKSEAYMEEFNVKMHNAIEAAVLLGVDYAVMHPNATTLPMKKYDRAAQYDSVMAHLSPFVEHANKVGLNVVVENMRVVPTFVMSHRYCQSPDELCDIADALGIGVCWDFGHANISGIKQSEGLGYIGKRLKAVHINDNAAVDDEHLAPFMGNVDWRDAMHGLALTGFDGVMNFELSTGKIPANVEMRKAFAKYVVNAANELMTYVE